MMMGKKEKKNIILLLYFSIHEVMQAKLQLNYIQNNVLQGLILGSGLNWAQDEKLCTLMQEAGKTLHM
jgi:predicted DNA-binding helix-hairpin-helix protein